MKSCMIWGDMSADRVGDQYPTVAVCDDCAEAHSKGDEDNEAAILSCGTHQSHDGDECHFCGKLSAEESSEK